MRIVRETMSQQRGEVFVETHRSPSGSNTVLRCSLLILLSAVVGGILSCGTTKTVPQAGPLSGNWEIALARHVSPNPPLVYTGFLVQSGSSISGNVMFDLAVGSGLCQGTGSITGTVNGLNIALDINEFGQDVSLTGTMPSGNVPLTGQFSTLAGGCTNFANTGTWTATSIAPIEGSFQGTFTSTAVPSNGAFSVTGALNQWPNTGNSTSELSGTISTSGTPGFCSYVPSATITGLISGTAVSLNLFGVNGARITQLGTVGNNTTVTVTADGKKLSGSYLFPSISSSCSGDQGTFELTFQ